MNKSKKKSVNRRVIGIAIATGLALTGIITLAGLSLNETLTKEQFAEDVDSLFEKSKESANDYSYCTVDLQIRTDSIDGEVLEQHVYTINKEHNTYDTKYTYNNDSGLSKIEYWTRVDDDVYEVYSYSPDLDTYVRGEMDFEPVRIDPWNIISSLSEYTLEDVSQWGVKKSNCYRLIKAGKNDEYEQVIETVYINTKTFKLEGIMTQGYKSDNHIDLEISGDNDVTQSGEDLDQVVTFVRYDFDWSNDVSYDVSMPGKSISIEEYNNYIKEE